MPVKEARIEQIARDGTGWHVHLVTEHGSGQARATIDFDHEPTQGEIEQGAKKWLKSLPGPPDLSSIKVGDNE